MEIRNKRLFCIVLGYSKPVKKKKIKERKIIKFYKKQR